MTVLDVRQPAAAGEQLLTYPNPTDGLLNVELALPRASAVTIVLHDLLGRERRRLEIPEQRRAHSCRLDLHGLEPGSYLLQMSAGGEIRTQTVQLR